MSRPIRLINAAKFFDGESHQLAAWNWLEEQLTNEQLSEFAEMYRAGPAPKPLLSNPLQVPYFSQRDNASRQGDRECFSSSCAMIAAFYGKVKSDDEYNKIRAKFGDTTNASAQVAALKSLGLKAEFRQNLKLSDLFAEINAGRPVATGWLHHSNYTKPSGGGHWSVVVGTLNRNTVHHDPMGAPDLINGGHKTANGRSIVFPTQYWLPRWEVKGNDGWGMIVRP
jgi:hypothetical protein